MGPTSSGLGAAPWSTSGPDLVDAAGNEVMIRGVNWFGFETSSFMPHGLWQRSWRSMLDQIAELGFNTIRLPFSSAMLEPGVRPVGIDASSNADVADLTSLELMDEIIGYSGELGLRIILDRHALGPDDRNELWYDETYSPERFIEDWELLAERYADDPTVIGADLHNEPHDQACWGCGDPAVDWRLAATEAGDAIHAIEPDWLIFVEGVEHVDGASCDGPEATDCIWWGGNLLDAAAEPIELARPDKVVYSPHEYATSVFRQPWFDDPAFPDNLPGIWDRFWGYLEQDEIAPVMVGELGTTLDDPVDAVWLEELLAYLDTNGIGFTFWTFNPNSGDTGGILTDDWETVDEERYGFLEPYLLGPFDGSTPESDDPSPAAPPTTQPAAPVTTAIPTTEPASASTCSLEVVNTWDSGYQADLTVTNAGDGTLDDWSVTWTFHDGERIANAWGVVATATGTSVTATAAEWNRSLAPGGVAEAGFVAEHDGSPDTPPDGLTLDGVPCG
ncbi:MAG: cellulase family glycosylhydrolase [Actinomycetota bacterium]